MEAGWSCSMSGMQEGADPCQQGSLLWQPDVSTGDLPGMLSSGNVERAELWGHSCATRGQAG